MLSFEAYDRHWLDFIVASRNGEKPWIGYDIIEGGVDKTYQLPISTYSFLSDINPSYSIMITEHKDDSEIYVEWDSLGYAIKLSEFTLKS